MTNDEIEIQALLSLGESFAQGALGSIFLARQRATDQARKEFAETEAASVIGVNTRQYLEGYLRDVASKSPTLTARVVKIPGSGWYCTQIHGGNVIMTASSVPYPGAMFAESNLRVELAQTNVPTLWDEPYKDRPEVLYAVLIHSRSRWDTSEEWSKYGHLPGSAYLAFPDSSLEHYIHKVDLFKRYPAIVERHLPKDFDGAARARWLERSITSYYLQK